MLYKIVSEKLAAAWVAGQLAAAAESPADLVANAEPHQQKQCLGT